MNSRMTGNAPTDNTGCWTPSTVGSSSVDAPDDAEGAVGGSSKDVPNDAKGGRMDCCLGGNTDDALEYTEGDWTAGDADGSTDDMQDDVEEGLQPFLGIKKYSI